MRLFVGIPLAAAVIDQLSAISMRLQSNGDGLRWSAPDSWHITLQFLGETGQEQYACIVARLRDLRRRPVTIRMEGLDCFDRVGIFFAGVALTPELLSLQQQVTTITGPCGFVPETRPYHPHITLARTKGKGRAKALDGLKARSQRQPALSGFVAEEFVLYQSVAGPTGSRYEIREHFRLDGE